MYWSKHHEDLDLISSSFPICSPGLQPSLTECTRYPLMWPWRVQTTHCATGSVFAIGIRQLVRSDWWVHRALVISVEIRTAIRRLVRHRYGDRGGVCDNDQSDLVGNEEDGGGNEGP